MRISILLLFFAALFISQDFASAQTAPKIYFNAGANQFSAGSDFKIDLLSDSQNPLNALQAEIYYSSEYLELLFLNTVNSAVSVWKESNTKTPGIIKLEGGSLEPFSGKAQKIAEVHFKAKKQGQAEIGFNIADFYLADGFGTKVSANYQPLYFTVALSDLPADNSLKGQDVIPPVISSLRIIKSPLENVLIAVFFAEDRGLGVKKTEARTFTVFGWTLWTQVSSPARVPSGALVLSFRAADNSGNVSGEKTVFIWQNIAVPATLFFIIIVSIVVSIVLLRRRVVKKF